ncbi:putative disease resistance protein, partial [Tanacetum coccineum]
MHGKLNSITTKLQDLEKEKVTFDIVVKDGKPKNVKRKYETSLPEFESGGIVGRQYDKKELLGMLLRDEPCNQNFSLVPIVGMGGVGKTTLARSLYNETQVKEHFELKMWVCVSDKFDIFNISNIIYQSLTGQNNEFADLNLLQLALKEKLSEKRFLLVLDDVWTDSYDDWVTLVRPFHVAAPNSKIIMTTRKHQLLKQLGYNHPYHLQILSHDDALCLFSQHAFGVNNFDSYPTLRALGDGIVEKCNGLPLALVALGRLMRVKTDVEEWKEVLNSEIWMLEDAIVPALRLSYSDLSSCLKQLFAYCSLFPKDYMFVKEDLVLLWMAEGFLHESTPTKSTEERLGHAHFEELLSRSFFQHASNHESLFVMHDLMNDLATAVAGDIFS